MNYLSIIFFIFIVLFLVVYYLIPSEYRYIALFIGSWIFYGFHDPKILIVLTCVTLVSYLGGLFIEKRRTRAVYCIFFFTEIMILLLFKFIFELPIGLSFIIFQTSTYLSDIYRKGMDAERNFIRYGAFAAFFPTILSGPIQKSRKLLPQIKAPSAFDADNAKKGTLLFIWGAFEKIMVADKLIAFSTTVIDRQSKYSNAGIFIAAVAFSLYIYADFSAYSDMARGIAKILGIDVGRNFNNPYLSCSLSEFWRRWHVSLNDWFMENVYIPLGGNRKGKVRKYLNILIVFAISGLWHGSAYHFVAWGIINGVLVIIGSILAPLKTGFYKKIKVDENVESITFIRRLIVFFLITLTWQFFNTGINDAIVICRRIIIFDFLSLFDPDLMNICGDSVKTIMTLLVTVIFCVIQTKRQSESSEYTRYLRQPLFIQCLVAAIVITVCIFGFYATGGSVDTRFLYFDF